MTLEAILFLMEKVNYILIQVLRELKGQLFLGTKHKMHTKEHIQKISGNYQWDVIKLALEMEC